MKRKILPVLTLLAAMTLVACGGKPADKSGAAPAKSTAATSKSSAATSRHTHTFNEQAWEHDEENHWHPATCEHTTVHGSEAPHTFVKDTTDPEYVEPTCKNAGVVVEKCSVCGYKKKTNVEANYQLHNFGERAWTVNAIPETLSTTTETLVKKCATCQEDDVILNARDFVAKGTTNSANAWGNKISDNTRVKLSKNGNYVEYKFNLDKDFAGEMFLYGIVDYWKDVDRGASSSNNNHNRGFMVSNNPNIKVTLDGATDVAVTNTKSYLEMGIPDQDANDPLATSAASSYYSGWGFAKVGAIEMEAGEHVLRYERTASYNMDITEIHFIGALTKHQPKAYEWEADGEVVGLVHKEKCTTDANKKAYRFDVSEATGWNQAGTKMNEKDQTKANSKSTWAVTEGAIPDGNYRVDFIVKMTSDHSARHWFNEAIWNQNHPEAQITLPGSNPDATTEDPFRYFIELNGTAAYPTTTQTWGEQGLSNTEFKTANEVINKVAVSGLTTFAMRHGNIGYSLIIQSVRLIAL